jgi:hypothetical protein
MELISAMQAATMGPVNRSVEALQKTGITERMPVVPSANPAMAKGALDAKPARANPTAAIFSSRDRSLVLIEHCGAGMKQPGSIADVKQFAIDLICSGDWASCCQCTFFQKGLK